MVFVPPIPCVEALISDAIVFGGGIFGRQLSLYDGLDAHAVSLHHEDTASRWPAICKPGRRIHPEPDHAATLTTLIPDFQPPEWEKEMLAA